MAFFLLNEFIRCVLTWIHRSFVESLNNVTMATLRYNNNVTHNLNKMWQTKMLSRKWIKVVTWIAFILFQFCSVMMGFLVSKCNSFPCHLWNWGFRGDVRLLTLTSIYIWHVRDICFERVCVANTSLIFYSDVKEKRKKHTHERKQSRRLLTTCIVFDVRLLTGGERKQESET